MIDTEEFKYLIDAKERREKFVSNICEELQNLIEVLQQLGINVSNMNVAYEPECNTVEFYE